MTIKQQPTSPSLSCTVADIVVATSAAQLAVTISVKALGASGEAETVYNETLLPISGQVELSELSSLLTPFSRDALAISVSVALQEKDSAGANTGTTESLTFTVLYSAADIDIDPQDFYDRYFLSIFQGTRRTAAGRLEYLHYYGADAATATARYADGSTKEFTLTAVSSSTVYTCIDVSPDQFAQDGKELTDYTVAAGQRSQTYMVCEAEDAAPIMLFTNSFGCQELLYCTGTHTVSPTYTRSQGRIRGRLTNYDIEETRTFKADTGWLTTEEAAWADDLFRSEEVYVCNAIPLDAGGYQIKPAKEVVITDSKSEISNDDDARPAFTFDYVYAQRTHNVLQFTRAGRIFDNTFDYTFN